MLRGVTALSPWVPALHAPAALVALAMGVLPLLGLPCERCGGGALSLALPWIGAVFYAGLAWTGRRRPSSPLLSHAVSLSVFVHADLMVESVLLGRLCWGCIAVAAFAFAAAAVRAVDVRPERLAAAAALLLGAGAAFVSPYERADYALTRRLWPARLLADLPPVVDRARVYACEHPAAELRLLVYEKDCRACSSATHRLIPQLRAAFGERLCIHVHEIPAPPPGARLPVFVLAARDRRLSALEGLPSFEELSALVHGLLPAR